VELQLSGAVRRRVGDYLYAPDAVISRLSRTAGSALIVAFYLCGLGPGDSFSAQTRSAARADRGSEPDDIAVGVRD
jgi:hypothetical protein